MSYLICNKCGSYYELQKGEFPEDPQNLRFWDSGNKVSYSFSDKCQCGGNLKYTEYLNEEKPIKLKSISIGVLIILSICFTTLYILPNWLLMALTVILTLIIGSFITSYTSGTKYKRGIVNGILAAVIAGCILFILIPIFYHLSPKISFLEYIAIIFIFIISLPAFLGLIGSLTAMAIKNGKMKLNWKAFSCGMIFTTIPIFFGGSLIFPPIGGFIAGSMTDGTYWEGIKHGFFTGSIGTTIALILGLFTTPKLLKNGILPNFSIENIVVFIFILILIFLACGVLGSIGGLIGAIAKKKSKNKSAENV